MKELLKKFPKISEVNQLVNIYEFFVNGLEPKLKIKILKHLTSGQFVGVANLEVKPKNGLQYYRALHAKDTEPEALEDALAGFFKNYNADARVRDVADW